jgi:hypothetical protein
MVVQATSNLHPNSDCESVENDVGETEAAKYYSKIFNKHRSDIRRHFNSSNSRRNSDSDNQKKSEQVRTNSLEESNKDIDDDCDTTDNDDNNHHLKHDHDNAADQNNEVLIIINKPNWKWWENSKTKDFKSCYNVLQGDPSILLPRSRSMTHPVD